MLHAVERTPLVDEANLRRLTPPEVPGDVHVLAAARRIPQHPTHLPSRRRPVHHRHRAAPLDRRNVDRVELHQALGDVRHSVRLEREHERLIGRPVQKPAVALERPRRRAVTAQRGEARAEIIADGARGDCDRTKRIDDGEEAAEEVIQPADLVDERDGAGCIEAHVHDVALGRRNHDAVDPRFGLERPGVGRHDFHARPRERHIQRARVRHVREIEPHDFTAAHCEPIAWLAVHEKHVAKPPHQCVGR